MSEREHERAWRRSTRRSIGMAAATSAILAAVSLTGVAPAQAYELNGRTWPEATLRIDTVYVPDGGYRDALNAAVDEYNAATDVSLSTSDTRGPAWNAQVADFGNTGVEADASTTFTGTTITAVTMRLNTSVLGDTLPQDRLKVVWEHEMGHSLGLDHSPELARVMYESASTAVRDGGVTGLTDDEIAGINYLY